MKREGTLERVIAKHTHVLRRGFDSWAALDLGRPPALGDARWTDDLILATWRQSETGRPPERLEHRVGRSGGGFDALDFRFLPPDRRLAAGASIDTSLTLNRRLNGPRIEIPVPWYGAGMSWLGQ